MKTDSTDNPRPYTASDGAKPSVNHNSGAPQPGVAAPEMHDLMTDVQALLTQLSHVADPDIARLRAKIADAIDVAGRALTDGGQRAQGRAREAMHAGEGYVRNQPWQAAGIAAAAGLLIGFLIARR